MKNTNQHSTRKWIERAACRCSILPNQPSRLAIAGAIIKPVIIAKGAAMNTVMK